MCDADSSGAHEDRCGTAEPFSSDPELDALSGWAPWSRADLAAGAAASASCPAPRRCGCRRTGVNVTARLHCPAICDYSGLDHGHVHGQKSGF